MLYVSSSLFELGALENVHNRTDLCRQVLEAIQAVIGKAGTIVVPTFSPSVGRLGTAFELETTPSETGIFSEYIREHPSSIRSLHPLHSVAALGQKAEEICLNVSNNSYAIGSPSYRLFAMNAKALALGAARPQTGWVHLLEFLSGVPYIYNKLLDVEVYEKKIKIQQEFFAPVRYLDFDITYDIVTAERLIANTGIFKFSSLGSGTICVVLASDYFNQGCKLIEANPYVFLRAVPSFRYGEVPFDGPTGSPDW